MLTMLPSWKAADPRVRVAVRVTMAKMEYPRAAKREAPLVQRLAKFAGKLFIKILPYSVGYTCS